MVLPSRALAPRSTGLVTLQETISVRTPGPMAFVDLTAMVERAVWRSRIRCGTVTVQSRHTTAAVVVNENEPLLIEDMRRTLERLAPRTNSYEHDDFARRIGPLPPDEPANGHSHCKALFLRTSESINILDGRLDLGTWQTIFLIELDGSRDRQVSLTLMGA